MDNLRLGVIGFSPGNGHPYSWSAIFNGYNPEVMEGCGFPVIPRYLEKQQFPASAIEGALVTHVWTQDTSISKHIAEAANIPNVCSEVADFYGEVDAVLLARDDAESHLTIGLDLLKAGMAVYIDKPLALTAADADLLISSQHYPGQLFSCSAMRYAPEFQLDQAELNSLGEVGAVHAMVPKDWEKYAVHVIEPALKLIPGRGALLRTSVWRSDDRVTLLAEFANGPELQINTMGRSVAPLSITLFGIREWKRLEFNDTFRAFRAALQDFVAGVRLRDVRITPDEMLDVVRIVEAGLKK